MLRVGDPPARTPAAMSGDADGRASNWASRHKANCKPNQWCSCGASRAYFGLPSGPRLWCSKCPDKPEGAVDKGNFLCSCGKRTSYALPGETMNQARWCHTCPERPPEAINVVSKTCACGRRIAFLGLPGGKRQWCKQCPDVPKGVVDLVHKRCECGRTRATLGPPNGRNCWCKNCPGYLQYRGSTGGSKARPSTGGKRRRSEAAAQRPQPPVASERAHEAFAFRTELAQLLSGDAPPDPTPPNAGQAKKRHSIRLGSLAALSADASLEKLRAFSAVHESARLVLDRPGSRS